MKRFFCLIMLTVCALALGSCVMKETSDDYYFHANGVDIVPGIHAEDALGCLGEHRSMQSSPSCAFDGEERIYRYSGFDIYTSWENGEEIIERVTVTEDSVATERGIRVGDSFHDVVKLYGRDYEKKGENIEYDGERCRLQFFFSEGKVTSIRYLADE